jgi:DNA-binding GntR family transcriptional regulator
MNTRAKATSGDSAQGSQSTPRRPKSPSKPGVRAPLVEQPDETTSWGAARPRTLVDHAVDEILSAASRGRILPGDRLSEPDLAAHLGMSRVPIREALRILESQGVVTSEPYKGIRLAEVSTQRLEQIIDVRVSLETLAACRAIEAGRNGASQIRRLDAAVAEMVLMAERQDAYGFATADTAFHRTLCDFAGNDVLCGLWESIARQLTVLFGLSTVGKPMPTIVGEHRDLVRVFAAGDVAALREELERHIRVQTLDVDYEAVIARYRREREKA